MKYNEIFVYNNMLLRRLEKCRFFSHLSCENLPKKAVLFIIGSIEIETKG